MVHSKKLEETALWKEYTKRNDVDCERYVWVNAVYEYAANYLKDVRRTFGNYTLHDETHILNVLEAMGGLLGNQITNLSVGELELLILAASLHDIGMVYTDKEKAEQYEDTETCKKFLREYYPEFLGSTVEDWTEDMQQRYLRTLHSERIAEVLNNKAWRELIHDKRPLKVAPLSCIIEVCKAHGYNLSDMINNSNLEDLSAADVSPLFCALLLRLADLLDFDDTRAPEVLYSYVECSEKSMEEWKKHQASAGFFYPDTPSADALPYKARCTNPGVEHAIRDFLDWIEVELWNCIKLQKYCKKDWQQKFPFPKAILRNEIESDGYMSGDFCITMDQTKILELLTGENLYDDRDVFVRELLQNAIDATLLRAKMDPNFIPEKSRIDFWEWNDKDGNIWFRIDDEGTGMTMGMLQRYFLKVGNSYYSSSEIDRDLREHNQMDKYHSISRFGIGFLSCFLNGDYAEVSTLYFDPDKNRREEETTSSSLKRHYGLRLQVTGLSGYYTLLNQAKEHSANEQMPKPEDYDLQTQASYKQERNGYRKKPGTSIAIRLNPGKLGTLNLKNTVKKYLCGARIPVYYNNERIGKTYEEIMEAAHAVAGEKVYELPDEIKEQFDQTFPEVRGQYPKIAITTVPLDTKEDYVLPGVSGVVVKYDVRFEKTPCWQIKDLEYKIESWISCSGTFKIRLYSYSLEENIDDRLRWEDLEEEYDEKTVATLVAAFENCDTCPESEEQLGKVGVLFREGHFGLKEIWKSYHDYIQYRFMDFSLKKCGYPDIISKEFDFSTENAKCAYQGVYAGKISTGAYAGSFSPYNVGIFFLENTGQPTTQANRAHVVKLPIEVSLYILGVVYKYKLEEFWYEIIRKEYAWNPEMDFTRKDWRNIEKLPLCQWMEYSLKDYFEQRKRFLNKNILCLIDIRKFNDINVGLFNLCQDAYLQEHKQMKINYEKGQTISFLKIEKNELKEVLNLFPPMLFCKAANDRNRKYICCADAYWRKGLTLDHPFIIWLMKNAFLLDKYYQRQFRQIIDCLRDKEAPNIISEINDIRQQLINLPEHHGVDVNGFPQLSEEDFWYIDR